MEDNAQSPTCLELTNSDGLLQSVTNCHQFGDLLRVGYIGQPLCSITIDSLFMFVQLAVVEQLNLLISLSGK